MARARRPPANSKPVTSSRSSAAWWRVLLIAAAVAIAYSNSLAGPFIYDDHLSIIENPQIRDLSKLGSVLVPERELPTAGWPLVNLSFALNYAFGGLNVSGYHVVNIALHLACGLVLFGVVRRTLQVPALAPRFAASAVNLALAAALIWTLHPLNTEAVDYLTQRTELMMGLFYLLTLYASIRAFGGPQWWKTLAVVSCAAGMGCKESMVTAPVTIALYDSIFLYGSASAAWRRRWPFYGALASTWMILVAVMWTGPRIHSAGFSTGISSWTYLLNQTVMLVEDLRRALWPRALVINYGFPLPLTLAQVWPYALIAAALIAAAVAAIIRQPKWGFLGAWFFITLAPTSSIVPIATEVGAERRMYLPLIALVVAAVVGASLLKRAASMGVAVVAVLALLLLAATFDRNREYASELLLSRTAVERHPTSVAHHMLASDLIVAGDHEAAMRELRLAIPGDTRAHHPLGAELLQAGRVNEAIDELQAFLRDQPLLITAVSARQLLGQAFVRQQRWAEAIAQGEMVLMMNPSPAERANAHALLGDAMIGAQKYADAIPHYQEYVRYKPGDFAAIMNLGIAFAATERLQEATEAFRRAAEIDPMSADAQRDLANALYDQHDAAAAAAAAERALQLRPSDPGAHDVLGRSLAVLGRLDEARAQFEQALQLEPENTEVRAHLATLRTLMRR